MDNRIRSTASGTLTSVDAVPPFRRCHRRLALVSWCVTATLLLGLAGPSASQASHVQNWGNLKCQSPGAVGSGMPIVYLNWNNLSNNYAKPYLYRWNGSSWQYRGTGVQTIQYGWGSWYRTDNGSRLSAWVWGSQPAGWYAIQMRVISYYTQSQVWGPYEYGWTDTNPYDIVGPTYCWVGSRAMKRSMPRPDPLPALPEPRAKRD